MKAVILAAGYATRLYPLTRDRPKALLPVAGRSLLDYTLDKIDACPGIDEVLLVTNARFAGMFRAWSEDRSRSGGAPLTVLNDGSTGNDNRLGASGDLWHAIRERELAEDLLVLPSDKLFDFSLSDLAAFFHKKKQAVNACFDTGDPEIIRGRHGCALLDAGGRILEIEEKPLHPRSTIQSLAFYVYPASLLPSIGRYLAEGGEPDAPGHLAAWLCRRVEMAAYLLSAPCLDVGTPAAYRAADAQYRKRRSRPKS